MELQKILFFSKEKWTVSYVPLNYLPIWCYFSMPFDFLIQTVYTCAFKNWIYSYCSVTCIFHRTIPHRHIYTYVSISSALDFSVSSFQQLFPSRFLLFKQCCINRACRHMHACLCVVLLLFPPGALFKVELLNQKGMYTLNFNKFCQIIF